MCGFSILLMVQSVNWKPKRGYLVTWAMWAKSGFSKLRAEIGDVERMLNALIKSLVKKHLDPWILESWNPGTLSPN